MEHKSVSEGLGDVGGVSKKGRGGPHSGGNFLQGSDTGGTFICLRYLGPIGGDIEDCGGESRRFYETNHREENILEGIWDVGYSQGGSNVGSDGDPVNNDLHGNNTGDGGTVCGAAANI